MGGQAPKQQLGLKSPWFANQASAPAPQGIGGVWGKLLPAVQAAAPASTTSPASTSNKPTSLWYPQDNGYVVPTGYQPGQIDSARPAPPGSSLSQPFDIATPAVRYAAPPGADHLTVPAMARGGTLKMPMRRTADMHRNTNFVRSGLINSTVPGRTDKHNVSVPEGGYILPADVVSGVGQGNTMAGAKAFDDMIHAEPWGTAKPSFGKGIGIPSASRGKFADGGATDNTRMVPIIVAGGEYFIHPKDVERLGNGDINHGHNVLDALVKRIRAGTRKTLGALPAPKK